MPRRYYLLLTAATLAGAFLRLWQLTQIPPGLHYDLAATALLGNEVAFHGYRPIFISAYTGHEALYYYWLALWFRAVGSSVFTLRLAAAMLGILAIPASFFALREAMYFERDLSLPLAALGATFLATAFFHVSFSRFGFRVISEPVVQALALGFLFRGLRKADGRALLLAGVFTGLAAYTYLAARLFPVPLAVFWLALLIGTWLGRRQTQNAPAPGTRAGRQALRQFLLFSLSALLTFAPLGLYFYQHPDDFFNRAAQIVPRAGESALLLSGIRRAAEMIFINGEPYDRFNIPGLPLFGSLLGLFFVIGLLVTIRNAIRPPRAGKRGSRGPGPTPLTQATEWLLLAWLPAMLIPTALSVHDIFPSNVRAFGLIPLLFVFPARGLLAAYRWAQHWLPGPIIPFAYPLSVITLAALAFGTYSTAQEYFVTWASLPGQRQNNDADLTDIAAYLNAHDAGEAAVYVSAIHYRHPTLAYLARDFDQIHWLTGGSALVIPAGRPALYVFARSAPPPAEWIAGWEPNLESAPLDTDGVPVFRAYRFAVGQTPPLPDFTPLEANFSNFATLTGYRLITQTIQIELDLRWRIDNLPVAGDFLPYARLADDWDNTWSQSGGFSYPSEQWQPGDTVVTRLTLPLPAGLPPGHYALTAGLYSAGTQTDLAHLDAQGAFAGVRAPVTGVTLPGGPAASLADFRDANPIAPPASQTGLGHSPALLGYSLARAQVRQGEKLDLNLYWTTETALAGAAALSDGLTIGLGQQTLYAGQPAHGTWPFGLWAPAQLLIDRYALKVPGTYPPGPALLSVSLPGVGSATLVTVTVDPVERALSAPVVSVTSGDTLGGLIALHGYDLTPGAPTNLTLVWHALAPIDADYTVFVHVLDSTGQVVAQADAQPRGGGYPTSLWEPGEYITDDYQFELPPGRYTAEAGLYLPETGQRLSVNGTRADSIHVPEFEIK